MVLEAEWWCRRQKGLMGNQHMLTERKKRLDSSPFLSAHRFRSFTTALCASSSCVQDGSFVPDANCISLAGKIRIYFCNKLCRIIHRLSSQNLQRREESSPAVHSVWDG